MHSPTVSVKYGTDFNRYIIDMGLEVPEDDQTSTEVQTIELPEGGITLSYEAKAVLMSAFGARLAMVLNQAIHSDIRLVTDQICSNPGTFTVAVISTRQANSILQFTGRIGEQAVTLAIALSQQSSDDQTATIGILEGTGDVVQTANVQTQFAPLEADLAYDMVTMAIALHEQM